MMSAVGLPPVPLWISTFILCTIAACSSSFWPLLLWGGIDWFNLLYRVFQKGWVKLIPPVQWVERMKKVPMNVGSQMTSERVMSKFVCW
jgi:hypothetical protein